MGFTTKFIRNRHFVLTMVTDGADDESLSDHVRALTIETEGMHPFVELADASGLSDISKLTEAGIALAGTIERERLPFKRDKLAILVSSDEVFNLARYYSATSNYFRSDTQIFRDFKEAIEWLGVADLEDVIDRMRKNEI